tara:strand:- start:1942 stop:2313 length:372 start_codon:yes stop_codon:yes gene_type:complete
MPYVMIPDGFSLKKVTRAQKDAVDAKRRHDDVVALLNNPNTPLVIGSAFATYFGVRLGRDIVTDLEARGVALTDDVKDKIKETVQAVNPLDVDVTKFIDTSAAPVQQEVTIRDLLERARERFS